MDPASVAAALQVEPADAVTLTWDATGQRPDGRARDALGGRHAPHDHGPGRARWPRSGQPLARPARAVFLTRAATTARAVATTAIGDAVASTTTFAVSFARPVDPATVGDRDPARPADPGTSSRPAIRLTAPDALHVRARRRRSARRRLPARSSPASATPTACRSMRSTLAVRTASAPGRRPLPARPPTRTNVARDAAISVRFSEPMDRRQHGARRSRSSVGGKAVAGTVRWAEQDTVLVFTPKSPLPVRRDGRRSTSAAGAATAAGGAARRRRATATFTTAGQARPARPAHVEPRGGSSASDGGGGGRRRQLGRGRDLLPRA